MVKETGGEVRELMPFVGNQPDKALSHIIRVGGFAKVRFAPHEKGGGDVA